MKKILIAAMFVLACLLSLCACGEQEEADSYGDLMEEMRSSDSPEPEEEEKRTLTVVTSIYSAYFESHAQAYMDQHPGVLIDVQQSLESGAIDSALSVQLMSGSGPDVIVHFPTAAVLQNGHFLDLYSFMERDPDFREEDYFMNTISALETDGCLYALTYNFSWPMYSMRRDLDPVSAEQFEQNERITYADMLDWYAAVGSPSGVEVCAAFSPYNCLYYYDDVLIDLEGQTCEFQNDDFKRVLEMAKSFPAPEVEYFPDNLVAHGRGFYASYFHEGLVDPEYPYLYMDHSSLQNWPQVLFPYEENLFTTPRLISSAGGKNLFSIGEAMSITDSCDDPELAWDFIKFCISEKDGPYQGAAAAGGEQSGDQTTQMFFSVGSFAVVNRATYAAQCRVNTQYQYDLGVELGMTPVGDREQIIADTVDALLSIPDQLELDGFRYSFVDEIVWPDMYLYLTDKQSVDITLENIQSKMALYLNE